MMTPSFRKKATRILHPVILFGSVLSMHVGCSKQSPNQEEVTTSPVLEPAPEMNFVFGQVFPEAYKTWVRDHLIPAMQARSLPLEPLLHDPDLYFEPASGVIRSRYDVGKPVWLDKNSNGTYESSVDLVVDGTPTEGTRGRQNGLLFEDRNFDGKFDKSHDRLTDFGENQSSLGSKTVLSLREIDLPSLVRMLNNDVRKGLAFPFFRKPYFLDPDAEDFGNWHGSQREDMLGQPWSEEGLRAAVLGAGAGGWTVLPEATFAVAGSELPVSASTRVEGELWPNNVVTRDQLVEMKAMVDALQHVVSPLFEYEGSASYVQLSGSRRIDSKHRFRRFDQGNLVDEDEGPGPVPGENPDRAFFAYGKEDGRFDEQKTFTGRYRVTLREPQHAKHMDLFIYRQERLGLSGASNQWAKVGPGQDLAADTLLAFTDYILPDEYREIPELPNHSNSVSARKGAVMYTLAPVAPVPNEPFVVEFEYSHDQVRDTDRDDIVDVGFDLTKAARAGGAITFQPEWSEPQVFIPIGLPPKGQIPAVHYLHQGNLSRKSDYISSKVQGDFTADGQYLVYSGHTRVFPEVLINQNGAHVKRFAVVRPRGNIVSFDFPWRPEDNTFDSVGRPIGINSGRTYVLADTTPNVHNDLSFHLRFASGIIHQFSGGVIGPLDNRSRRLGARIDAIIDAQGRSIDYPGPAAPRLENTGRPEITQTFGETPRTTVEWYVDWEEGQVAKVRRVFSQGGTKTTTLHYDEQGRITKLQKDDPSLNYELIDGAIHWGATSEAAVKFSKAGDTITTTLPGDGGSWSTTTNFTPAGYVASIRHSLNGVAEPPTTFTYGVDEGRYTKTRVLKSSSLKKVVYPDGRWEAYEHDPITGWVIKIKRPSKDTPPELNDGPPDENQMDIVLLGYEKMAPQGDAKRLNRMVERPRSIEFRDRGVVVGYEYRNYLGDETETRTYNSSAEVPSWDSPHVTTKLTANGSRSHQVHGSHVLSSEENAFGKRAVSSAGQGLSKRGKVWYVGPWGQTLIQRIEGQGRTSDGTGTAVFTIEEMNATEFDSWGRASRFEWSDGTAEILEGLHWHLGSTKRTDRQGIDTEYTYTILGQVKSIKRLGVTTTFSYDALGHVTKTVKTDGNETIETLAAYDALGRLRSSTDARSQTTTHEFYEPGAFSLEAEADALPGPTRETVFPDGSRRFEHRYLDGRLRSVQLVAAGSDTPLTEVAYDYGANAEGAWIEEQRPNHEGLLVHKTRRYFNAMGQIRKITRATADHGVVTTLERSFDDVGQVQKETDGDGVVTLFEYDGRGELTRKAIDRNGNGVIDLSPEAGAQGSADIVFSIERGLAHHNGSLAFFTRHTRGVGDTAVETVERVGVHGRKRWYSEGGIDKWQSERTPSVGGTWDIVTKTSDGRVFSEHYENSRLKSMTQGGNGIEEIEIASFTHDGFGRTISRTSSEGTVSYELDEEGLVQTVVDGVGQATALTRNPLGALSQMTLPSGVVRSFAWSPDGNLEKASGAGQYTFAAKREGLGLPRLSWKQTADGPDIETSWSGDAGGIEKSVNGVVTESVRFTPGGRPKSVTRGHLNALDRQTLEREYDAGGLLSSIRKVDANGNLVGSMPVTVDSAGRTRSLGNLHFGYTARNRVHRESIPQVSGMALVRDYDEQDRVTRLTLEMDGTVTRTYEYAYDSAGRLASTKEGTRSVTYIYEPGTTQVKDVIHHHAASAVVKTSLSHDVGGRLIGIHSRPAQNDTAVGFLKQTYDYDDVHRVSEIVQTIYDPFESIETKVRYGYDKRDQLTSAQMVVAGDQAEQAVEGRTVLFEYDEIGNRTKSGLEDEWDTFVAAPRNFYTASTSSGRVEIGGAAHPDATVTVTAVEPTSGLVLAQDASVERTGSWFYYQLDPAGALPGQTVVLTFTIVLPGLAVDSVGEATVNVVLPHGSDAPEHDSPGRRALDAYYEYTWTPEGRLRSVESPLDFKVSYGYDALGRRVSRKLWLWDTATGAFSENPSKDTRYVYDNRRIIAEFDAKTEAVVATYLWGLDFSGTLNGAHGVRGLVAFQRAGQSFYPVMDRGGNVRVLANAAGEVAMTYDYSPYGRLLAIDNFSAPTDDINPFLFSTKLYDFKTQLYDFGLRSYDPSQGRWLSEDPAGEDGGLNLFAAFANDPINQVDVLGATPQNLNSAQAPSGVPWVPDDTQFNPANAHFGAVVSIIAYKGANEIVRKMRAMGFEDVRVMDRPLTDAQAFTAYDPKTNTALVAFRGTEINKREGPVKTLAASPDLRLDLVGVPVPALSPHKHGLSGGVHLGFYLQFLEVKARILQNIEDYRQRNPEGFKIFVAGHSLGGALATIFSAHGLQESLPITSTYTIGQPPAGTAAFMSGFKENLDRTGSGFFRTVHLMDITPNVGSIARWLTHGDAGDEIYIDRKGVAHFNASGVTKRLDRILSLANPTRAAKGLFADHGSRVYEAYLRTLEREFVGRVP